MDYKVILIMIISYTCNAMELKQLSVSNNKKEIYTITNQKIAELSQSMVEEKITAVGYFYKAVQDSEYIIPECCAQEELKKLELLDESGKKIRQEIYEAFQESCAIS